MINGNKAHADGGVIYISQIKCHESSNEYLESCVVNN